MGVGGGGRGGYAKKVSTFCGQAKMEIWKRLSPEPQVIRHDVRQAGASSKCHVMDVPSGMDRGSCDGLE